MAREAAASARGVLALVGAVLLGLTACSSPAVTPSGADEGRHTGTARPTPSEPAPDASGVTPDASGKTPDASGETGSDPAQETGSGRAEVLFTGDLMLARSIGELILAEGPEAPWAGIADELAAADLRVGVLETAVGTVGEPEDKAFTFRAPPEAATSLAAAGFDVVTLANNHSYDFGAAGLAQTLELVFDAGVGHVGAGDVLETARAPVVLGAEGVELAFLGYVSLPDDWTGYRNRDWAAGEGTPGVAWADPELIAQDVAKVRDEVDHVVVLLHAGDEGSAVVNEVQVAAAEAAFGAGASAVVGSHPHVLQGWSQDDDGRLVAWSLGNTVFDGFGDFPDSLRGALLEVTFTPEEITDVRWVPVVVDERGLPVAVDPADEPGRAILEELDSLPVPELAAWSE